MEVRREESLQGPEVTEPRWPEHPWGGLSVSLQGVTADTISHLADLGRTVKLLYIYGPEVTEPRWPERYGIGLSVSLQGVAADTISHLADLGRTVTLLEIYDCPDLTAGSLEPLARCPVLRELTLSGGVPDAVLDSLSGCPRLEYLTLGDRQRPAETAFTAVAYTRLVKSCRKLVFLYLHCTADTTRAVLTALKEADLRDSDGEPRTIWLQCPRRVSALSTGELYDQLKSQEGR
ncbi:hypothetical protein FJT64_013913 [Amphibalanus amphitrite]|uniref:Uncharacterized protein n=1 Tax=Amphibalanus amphitrite TaxID=1232801 RepID=A0A6A4VAN1_AMPAM|nr:hypothetical protein FJT64_013913 [Amphibalanus amphitrite]